MPNHVTQVLTAEGPDALARMRAYFTDFDVESDFGKREQWRGFDFGKVIPRPAILDTIVENGADRYIPFLMNLDGAHILWRDLCKSQWPQLKERPLPPWQGFESLRDGWMERHLRRTFGDEPIDNAYRMIKAFAETGHKGWYDWSIANWGTKWNAYSSDENPSDPSGTGDVARVRFNSAWSPPEPVLKKLAEIEPTLSFNYVAVCEHTEFYAVGEARAGIFELSERRDCTPQNEEFIAAFVACYDTKPEWDDDDD